MDRHEATTTPVNVSVPFFIDEKTADADRAGIMKKMVSKKSMRVPAFIATTLLGVPRKHRRSEFAVGTFEDIDRLATAAPVRLDRSALDRLRARIQEACQNALVGHVSTTLETAERLSALPPLSELNRDAIAFRCANQLADCAVYDIRPPDLARYRQRQADKERQSWRDELAEAYTRLRQSARYANQREQDAQRLLAARSGSAKGPLPVDNLACADVLEGRFGPPTTAVAEVQSPYEIQMQTVVALVMETLLNAERAESAPLQGRVNAVNQIMKQARVLSVQDAVLVLVRPKSGESPLQGLVVHYTEARALVLGESGDEAEVDARLAPWREAHESEGKNPHGLQRKPIGEGGEIIRPDLSPLEIGYECPNRAGYYRTPEDGAYVWEERDLNYRRHEAGGDCLPDRASLPLGKSIQYFYLCQNGVRFEVKSCFRAIPNILFPTCPMINLLMVGSMPYHMGSHAMLDQYAMLMWAAINRACPLGMGPIASEEAPMTSAGGDRGGATAARSEWCVKMLMRARNHQGPLPNWCGKWFVPAAYMPRATTPEELDLFYPRADMQYRRLVGEAWLRGGPGTLTSDVLAGVDEAIREQHPDGEINALPEDGDESRERKMRDSMRDTSPAGRAEYVMTLALMSAYFDMIDAWEAQYNARVAQLREKYAGGTKLVELVNAARRVPVRPREYYDELWNVCIEHTAALLEIHEVIILMLNSRWVDVTKAVQRMSVQHNRAHAKMVQNANAISAQIVRVHRERNHARRLEMVDHLPEYFDRVIRAPWVHEAPGASGPRPDLPTYGHLMVFEEFHAAIPVANPARKKAAGARTKSLVDEDDPMMADLIAKTKEMSLRIQQEQEADTEYVMQRYELPLKKVRPPIWQDPHGQKHEQGPAPVVEPGTNQKRARN